MVKDKEETKTKVYNTIHCKLYIEQHEPTKTVVLRKDKVILPSGYF